MQISTRGIVATVTESAGQNGIKMKLILLL